MSAKPSCAPEGAGHWSGLQHALVPRLWPRFAVSQGEGNVTPHPCGARLEPAPHRIRQRVSFHRRQGFVSPLRALDRAGAGAVRLEARLTKKRIPRPRPYNGVMRITQQNPLLWLLLLLTAWACLAAPPCGAKTASWQNSGPETASSEMTAWEAAPRLGFGGLAEESASAALVATESAAVPAGYIRNVDGTVSGPLGGTYTTTGAVDANGNSIYVGGNGNYYTLSAEGSTRIPSPNPPSGIGVTGQIGEDYLQASFETTQGIRFVDQLTLDNVANESKVGYTSLDADTALQVSKDTELLNTNVVNGVTWHFFTSPVTGLNGPSPGLYNALTNAGINIVIHP